VGRLLEYQTYIIQQRKQMQSKEVTLNVKEQLQSMKENTGETILATFEKKLENISSKEHLEKTVSEFKQSDAYQVLQTSPSLTPQTSHPTPCLDAFEKLVQEKQQQLDAPEQSGSSSLS
jgi:hypothetical protein